MHFGMATIYREFIALFFVVDFTLCWFYAVVYLFIYIYSIACRCGAQKVYNFSKTLSSAQRLNHY